MPATDRSLAEKPCSGDNGLQALLTIGWESRVSSYEEGSHS